MINRWEVMKWGGGGKRFSGDLSNLLAREGTKNISLELSFIYLNLTGQTNASIESVPGTSQPQRNITRVPRLDINYIMSRHSFDKTELT